LKCSKNNVPSNDERISININNTKKRDSLTIVDDFNNYFLKVFETISSYAANIDSLQYKKNF